MIKLELTEKKKRKKKNGNEDWEWKKSGEKLKDHKETLTTIN